MRQTDVPDSRTIEYCFHRGIPTMRCSLHPAVAGFCAATLLLTTAPLRAQASYPDRCGSGLPPTERAGYTPLPRGDVFCPLVADPKAVRSLVSLLDERSGSGAPTTSSRLASVGIGDLFGLGRRSEEHTSEL